MIFAVIQNSQKGKIKDILFSEIGLRAFDAKKLLLILHIGSLSGKKLFTLQM